jgi:hypothetical protein
MAAGGELKLRLTRADDAPDHNPSGDPFEFGLQDTRQQVHPGQRTAGGGFVWDFTVRVQPGRDAGRPNFLGPFASGPADDRFVQLAWRSTVRGVWINRVKARLSGIDWEMVQASQAADKPLVADMTGWRPHDSRRQVAWRIG